MSDPTISRRTVLRGVGAALALPWLEAMAPTGLPRRLAAATDGVGATPVRLAVLFMPNGVHPDRWTPKTTGRDFELSPTLEPLRGIEREVLVLSNLWNRASDADEGHYVKTSGFLTSTRIEKTLGVDLNCHGVSMDQVAARAIGSRTPIPSLELGIEPVRTGVDTNVGYTRVYGSHIAWRAPTVPLPREIAPRLVWERLLRAGRGDDSPDARDRRLLDRVLGDARRLEGRLGRADRRRLDEYLESVRSLERRLERGEEQATPWTPRALIDPTSAPPEAPPGESAEHVRLMLDLIALAFQTDSTRVVTFLFGNAVSNRDFSFLDGVRGSHHSISHHQSEAEKLEQYALINRWHVAEYAYLLRRLASMPEGEETVLDHSMVVFGSGLRDGDRHDPHDLPILVGGRGGGALDPGQHVSYPKDSPLSNLWLTLLRASGVPTDAFADSTGPLREILRRRVDV